ncbi:transglutaminase-like cysteine peptidase [Parvibaculum lavamentivorans]|nr:transglutaminase-like cysteine peptidase [Parvibaculum lavamentivorans]
MQPILNIALHIALLDEVNRDVNRSVIFLSDLKQYNRKEFWTTTSTAGDCEDFVLAKRARLMDAGLPWQLLLPATGKIANGEGHAVLLIDTTFGLQALDNLTNEILPWNRCSIIDWYGYADPSSEPMLWRQLLPYGMRVPHRKPLRIKTGEDTQAS